MSSAGAGAEEMAQAARTASRKLVVRNSVPMHAPPAARLAPIGPTATTNERSRLCRRCRRRPAWRRSIGSQVNPHRALVRGRIRWLRFLTLAVAPPPADALVAKEAAILAENAKDVKIATDTKSVPDSTLQRLKLKPGKIANLAEGIRAIANMDEPINRTLRKTQVRPFRLLVRGWHARGAGDASLALPCLFWVTRERR